VNRPEPKFEEVAEIKKRSQLASHVAFVINANALIEFEDYALQGVNVFGISEEENDIQPVTMGYGRFISGAEFASGSSVAIIGYTNAENLFGSPSAAVGKEIKIKGMKATIVGVIKKMGTSMVGWDYDQCLMIPYRFAREVFYEKNSHPKVIVNGKANVSSVALADELEGIMRSVRKLSPKQEDNFTVNQISGFADRISSFFGSVNL